MKINRTFALLMFLGLWINCPAFAIDIEDKSPKPLTNQQLLANIAKFAADAGDLPHENTRKLALLDARTAKSFQLSQPDIRVYEFLETAAEFILTCQPSWTSVTLYNYALAFNTHTPSQSHTTVTNFMTALAQHPTLTALDITNCCVDFDVIAPVLKSTTLRTINFPRSTCKGPQHSSAFLTALSVNKTLTEVFIDGSYFSDADKKFLADILGKKGIRHKNEEDPKPHES